MNIPKINKEAASLVSKKKRHLTFVHITDWLVKIRARGRGGGGGVACKEDGQIFGLQTSRHVNILVFGDRSC